MISFRNLPIRWKVMLLITGTGFTILFASITALIVYDRYKFQENLVNELSMLSRAVESDLRAAIALDFNDEAKNTLENLKAKPSIIGACAYDRENRLFAELIVRSEDIGCPETPDSYGTYFLDKHIDYISEISGFEGESPEGSILIRADFSELEARLKADILFFLIILLISSVLAFLVATRLHHFISGPILALAKNAQYVTDHGDYSARTDRLGDDEVGKLVTSFNMMLSRIQEREAEVKATNEELSRSHQQLEQYSGDLETQVKKRTEELAVAVKQAEEARDKAEEANKAKSIFLANMSHELRTPMNAIIGFSRIVMNRCEEILPKKQHENMEKILISANHLLGLINDILDLSKIEAGKMEVIASQFPLKPLVEMTLRTVEPMASGKDLAFSCQFEDEIPNITSDQDKLKQIMLNLLSNAIKFTPSGEVNVEVKKNGERIKIAVSDTGIGIAEDKLSTVFEEFTQLDSGSTKRFSGTGLGLSITRHLAKLIGGDILVKSSTGAGSTFTVDLPMHFSGAVGSRI